MKGYSLGIWYILLGFGFTVFLIRLSSLDYSNFLWEDYLGMFYF